MNSLQTIVVLGFIGASVIGVSACKERGASSLKNRPEAAGGGGGPTWTPSPNEGKYMDCKSDSAMKKDYLAQLRNHLVYGDMSKVRMGDPVGADMGEYYQGELKRLGITSNTFANLDESKLFDGAKGFNVTVGSSVEKLLRPGDVLLNFNFGQSKRPGNFYSKRGIAHARLVVGYSASGELLTFDGGWEGFSKLKQVHSQTIWLRPNPEFVKPGDIDNLVKWAKLMEPLKYDNTLTDYWAEYRSILHGYLDSGKPQVESREKALAQAKAGNFAPGAPPDTFLPESGIYCSEGTAAIYAYLGFRMYGETAFDIISKFDKNGGLPGWAVYADALSGFSADSDPNTFMMHNLFHSYFSFFDQARKGLIKSPDTNIATTSFAVAMKANITASKNTNQNPDLLGSQLDDAVEALSATQVPREGEAKKAEEIAKVKKLKEALIQVAQATGQGTISNAVDFVFFRNQSYGPHSFFENAKHFALKGVFYNSDLRSGYQAKWIADWWIAPYGQPRLSANISTTLYRINRDMTSLPEDKCLPGEAAPILTTR